MRENLTWQPSKARISPYIERIMNSAPERSYICPVLIGRSAQLESLDRAMRQALRGGRVAVLLSGEAGIGKSRLASEAIARATAEGFLVLKGDCYESGHSVPYSAILEMLRTYVSGRSTEQAVNDLGPEATEILKLLPEIAWSAPSESAAVPQLDAEQEKRRLFQALLRVISRLGAQRPVLILIEDLHWSDQTTLEFLLFLCRYPKGQSPAARLWILLTYRSDEAQSALSHFLAELDRTRSAVELALNRLTLAETDVMTRAILDLHQPARREFLQALHGVTNGNPFFIEEVLKASFGRHRSASRLVEDQTSYGIDVDQVPRTVQDALRQRLAQLSERARRLLDVAAVAGMRLDIDLLGEFTQQEAETLLAPLKELVAAQLIVDEEAGFAFRHALTRQAVYSQLLRIERRQLHRHIGEARERLYQASPQQQEMHIGELAYHFCEAEAWDKALPYCERAGELANELSTPVAVIQHLSRAREAARRISRTLSPRVLRLLANAYEVVGEFEHARATMEAALEAAVQQSDDREQWQALIGLGMIWCSRDYLKTGELWRSALELARALADQSLLARSLNRVGNWYLNREAPVDAVQHHEEALRIFERVGDIGGIAETVDLLGMAWFVGGDLIRSRAHYERALPLFEQLHDTQGYASSLATVSVCAPVYHTDTLSPAVTFTQGAEWLEQARRLTRDIGWRSGESYALIDLGLVLGPAGQYGRALECTRGGLAIAEEIGHLQWMSCALWTLGSIQLDLLDLAAARTTLERAYATATETGSLHWTRVSAGSLARCYLAVGDMAHAEAVLEETRDTGAGYRTLGQRAIGTARVELALASKRPDRATGLVESMIHSAAGEHVASPRLASLRADALVLLDDRYGAEATYLDAAEQARRQGQRGQLWRIHAALSRLYRAMGQRSHSLEHRQIAQDVIDDLAETVPDAVQRETFRATAALCFPPQATARQAAKVAFGGLTEREREVAVLLARGLTNAEIATTLVISERTVETHITNILAKLRFSSRAQIAAWTVESGLIPRG
jgi:DNA-binding NarL/FixJ family response regulator